MSNENIQSALNAIIDEAEKLLSENLESEVLGKVELILSIARHGLDVRSTQETS